MEPYQAALYSPPPLYKRKIFWIYILILILIPVSFYLYKANPIFIKKFALACPVAEEICHQAKEASFQGYPALEFLLPAKALVTSAAEVADFNTFSTRDENKNKLKGIYSSYVSDETCLRVTYLFADNVEVRKIDLLPLSKGDTLATASGKLILQVQKGTLDQSTTNQPDYVRCPVTNLQNKDFGEYLSPKEIKFK